MSDNYLDWHDYPIKEEDLKLKHKISEIQDNFNDLDDELFSKSYNSSYFIQSSDSQYLAGYMNLLYKYMKETNYYHASALFERDFYLLNFQDRFNSQDKNLSNLNKKIDDNSKKFDESNKKVESDVKELRSFIEDNTSNQEILKKLDLIESKSDNEQLQEGFKQLSETLVTNINNNNKNNISLLIGVIIGIFAIQAFFMSYNNKL